MLPRGRDAARTTRRPIAPLVVQLVRGRRLPEAVWNMVAKGGIEPPIQGFSAQREHNSQPRNQSLINACQIFSNGLRQGKTWAAAYTRCTVATRSGAKDLSAKRHCPAESISPMACLSDTTKSGRTTRWETCHQRAIASVWVAGRQHALGAANRARSDKPCPPPLARPHRRTHSPAR